jgi:pimeloyl-ACP methyl ester carboxylesterase
MMSTACRVTATFPVGYVSFHDDIGLNFQMNRWMTWIGERAADDLHRVASRIRTYDDWKREMLELADEKVHAGALLDAAYYVRAAEFFMLPGDRDKRPAYDRFLELIDCHYGDLAAHRHHVPYETGALPAYRFAASEAKGVVVICGGFDSFIEEFLPVVFAVRDAGFELIAFEGPGQGGALVRHGLPMTPCWERPVAAILDHFALTEVTLIGVSLGGCLVMRAAAFEGRVRRVVAFDVLFDLLDATLHARPRSVRGIARSLLALRAGPVLNVLVHRLAARDLLARWGVAQGMYALGVESPYRFLRKAREFRTWDVSHRLTQDVLLLAGSADHYVPIEQLHRQMLALTNARSVTARVFMPAEQAQNHCQIGNIGLAVRVILRWLDGTVPAGGTSGACARG